MGYLPAALRNYLVRLGWSHADQEIFSTEEMIELFDLAHIGRSPARFDFAKLESLNGHYLRQTGDAELLAELERVLPHIAGGSEIAKKLTPQVRRQLLAAMGALKERAKTLVELADGASFVVADRPLRPDQKAETLLSPETRELLGQLLDELRTLDPWTAETTEQAIRGFSIRSGMKLGNIAQPLRAALTGRTTSPPIFEVLAVLGKDESLARIGDQVPAAIAQR
jgi:glutamyl-tRNA synthetase